MAAQNRRLFALHAAKDAAHYIAGDIARHLPDGRLDGRFADGLAMAVVCAGRVRFGKQIGEMVEDLIVVFWLIPLGRSSRSTT